MRNIFIFTFLSFLLASITTTAFEDDTKVSSPKIVYKLNAALDDLVLNYMILKKFLLDTWLLPRFYK